MTALRDMPTPTATFAIETMLKVVPLLVPRLLDFHWSLEVDRRREFITSDVPVVLWKKPTPRDHYAGFGIENATELRFPIDPGAQLVLSRRPRRARIDIAQHRVRRSNADLAEGCHRLIVANRRNRSQIDAQRLDARRPLIRFDVGPLWVRDPDGSSRKAPGEVLHMWVPRGPAYGHPEAD